MQIAAARPAATTTAAAPTALSLPAPGETFATVNFRAGNWSVSQTGTVIGPADGFATLDAAIGAAETASRGIGTTAAGVFEIEGAFHVRALKALWYDYLRPEFNEPSGSYTHLEWLHSLKFSPPQFPFVRIGTDPSHKQFPTHPALRAIIDGAAHLNVPAPV